MTPWTGLYRAALWLYPPGFRRRYGEMMRQDAEQLLNAARESGASGLGVANRLFADLARSVPREWRRRLTSPTTGGQPDPDRRHIGSGLGQDAVAALRSLVRRPAFSAGLICLLGVGIGACLMVASVVRAYVLRPLPYPDSERLVLVSPAVPVNVSEVGDLFEVPVSWDLDVYTLLDEDAPALVYGAWVSPGYTEAFGLRVAIGRLFTADEAAPGGAAVAIISHDLWQSRYGGDPSVVGRRLTAFTSDRPDDSETFTIVGVLDRDSWHYQRYTDFLTPLRSDRTVYGGRLRAGVPLATAARVLEERGRARMTEVPDGFRVEVVPLQRTYTERLRPVLGVAIATVLLALLIVCGNSAALLLVRAAGRDREFVIRSALGAGRGRLVRQLLIEGLTLAGTATAVGVGLAAVGLHLFAEPLQAQLGREVPGGADALGLDGFTFLCAVGLTMVTGAAFGLAPLAGRLRLLGRSRADGGRSVTSGRSRRRTLRVIVAGGVALCLTLVVPAGLALRSVRHLSHLELGFQPEEIYSGGILVRGASYPTLLERGQFFQRVAAAAATISGVESAAMGVQLPFQSDYAPRTIEREPESQLAGRSSIQADVMMHDARWFETLRVPVKQGRSFRSDDLPGSEPVTVIGQSAADQLWPGLDPLGRRLRVREAGAMGSSEPGPWLRVVGVAGDVLASVDDAQRFGIHVPLAQGVGVWTLAVLRMRAGAPDPAADLRRALRGLDPTVSLSETGWLQDKVSEAARPARFLATLLGTFAAFAIAIAILGLYAVLSFAAAQRKRDIAIRMAVGAGSHHVLRQFLGEGMALVMSGLAVGCIGATLLARGVIGQLHGVGQLDPVVFAAALVTLSLVGALAAWLPARRASQADPMAVLREE